MLCLRPDATDADSLGERNGEEISKSGRIDYGCVLTIAIIAGNPRGNDIGSGLIARRVADETVSLAGPREELSSLVRSRDLSGLSQIPVLGSIKS